MKKILAMFLLSVFVFSFCACNDSADKNSTSSVQVEEEEYSGAIFVTRTENEDGGYVLRDYREDGTLAAEHIYGKSALLSSESFYSQKGQIENQKNYGADGKVASEVKYTVDGRTVSLNSYGDNGKYAGKVVVEYDSFDYIISVKNYNLDDVLGDEILYSYDASGICVRSEDIRYNDGFPYSTLIQIFDSATGKLHTEEAILYTEEGEFLYHEVYEWQGEDAVLVARYDANGNALPLTEEE